MKKFPGFFFLALLFSIPSYAYNFLYIHPTEGTPIGWEKGTTIQYYLDPGKLGRLTNDQAHTLLKEAMKIWEEASPYADVPKFEFAGYLPEDVDGTNYQAYVTPYECYAQDLNACGSDSQKNLQTVVVFDQDSSILNGVLCQISGCSAYASANVFSGDLQDPGEIVQGIVVLGGQSWNLPPPDGRYISALVGTMVHELGHLLGLAHTSVNQGIFINTESDKNHLMPTMFFSDVPLGVLNEKNQATLNPDDIAGISTLYPSDGFTANTASIQGEILKSDGSPMMHVNVVARNTEDPLCQAYSFLSGRLCTHTQIGQYCLTEDGNFTISGLPSGSYALEVEEVASDSLAQTLAPGLFDEFIYGDSEFWNEGDAVNELNTQFDTLSLSPGEMTEGVDIILSGNEVTEDRIKYIPLTSFTPDPGDPCPEEPEIDYAALIGIEETDDNNSGDPNGNSDGTTSSTGGCSLLPHSF